MIDRRRFLSATASAAALAATGLPSLGNAQTVQKNSRIIVGFPPGGSTDYVSRVLADKIRGADAPQVLVENRPGAGGRLGVELLKAADPDGSTMLLSPASMMAIYPHVFRKLNYNVFADVIPVTMLCSFPFGFSVGPAVPESVKTMGDFAAWAKSYGKPINYGSPGAGSMPHFTGFSLGRSMGIDMTHIAFKGGAPSVQDLIGGQIHVAVGVIGEHLPNFRAGRLRILAQTGPTRSPYVPDVPTLAEQGIRDVVAREWFGMFLPAKTPPNIVAALNGALREASRAKDLIEGYGKLAYDVESQTASDFAVSLRTEYDRWAPIVKASGFSSEE